MKDLVSCVVDTRTDTRVSKYYSRLGDAKRAAEQLNGYEELESNPYQAQEFALAPKYNPWAIVKSSLPNWFPRSVECRFADDAQLDLEIELENVNTLQTIILSGVSEKGATYDRTIQNQDH